MAARPLIDVLIAVHGWITPGTNRYLRKLQCDEHLAFLARPPTAATRYTTACHCGWWLDHAARPSVRRLTAGNPEPARNLTPCDARTLASLANFVAAGRVEFFVYPYAACVAEVTTGESLLRSLRASRDLVTNVLGSPARQVGLHDYYYNLDWGSPQFPQLARILGFSIIRAGVEGYVRAADGSAVRLSGPDVPAELIIAGHVPPGRIRSFDLELHSHLSLAKNMADRPEDYPYRLRSVRLDDYLAAAPRRPVHDAQVMGSKGWFGGVMDGLLQEQNARTVELRLPAVEALALQRGAAERTAAPLQDLWKKAWILLDNHTFWQCHNYKAHYLPRSAEVAAELGRVESKLLGATPRATDRWAMFNPTPWTRDLTTDVRGRTIVARGVPGWSAVVVGRDAAAKRRRDTDTTTLDNGVARFKLNRRGEVVEAMLRGEGGAFHVQSAGLGRLVRIHERPMNRTRRLRAGQKIAPFEGALCVSTVVKLPARCERITLSVGRIEGEVYIVQADLLDPRGRVIGTQYRKVHSLHWGGAGMPNRRSKIEPLTFGTAGSESERAAAVRLTLWMIAEGAVAVGPGVVRLEGQTLRSVRVSQWTARLIYRNAYTGPSGVRARVVRSDEACKTVRFTGKLLETRYTLDVSLRAGERAAECRLVLDFPRETDWGLSTPPLTRAEGSFLGALCERPYVPGLAVLLPVGPQKARGRYFSDKLCAVERALRPSPHTWHTDRRDWWLGMSPFLGMNMAAAESGKAQVGVLTRGLMHFFRWRREGAEMLGLSLGATIHHPMTQGSSVPPGSRFHTLLGRKDHEPYTDLSFLRARGEYVFHYAVAAERAGDAGRRALWRQAQQSALPSHAVPTGQPIGVLAPGVACEPASAVVTALEPTGDAVLLRVTSYADRAVRATVRLPWEITGAEARAGERRPAVEGNRVTFYLPRLAVRELIVRPSPRKKNEAAR